MPRFNDSWATICRHARQSHGLKQADFAELIGRDTNTVSRWERGVNAPPKAVQRKIVDLFYRGIDAELAAARLSVSPFLTRIAHYRHPAITVAATPRWARLHYKSMNDLKGFDVRSALPFSAWSNIDQIAKNDAVKSGDALAFTICGHCGDGNVHNIHGTMIQRGDCKLWRIDYSEPVKEELHAPEIYTAEDLLSQ
ncbi:MAG: helix-turn-helix domain-containing protein [Hyphomicrobiaceae bacterium]